MIRNSSMITRSGKHLSDDDGLFLGTGDTWKIEHHTDDANANYLAIILNSDAGAVDVAGVVISDTTGDKDTVFFNGLTEPFIAVLNDAADAYIRIDAGDDAVAGAKGIFFNPAGDEDVEIINMGTTNAGRVWWDESQGCFRFSGIGFSLRADAGSASIDGFQVDDNKSFILGNGTDFYITYNTADADAKILEFQCVEGDDSGNNVPVFAFMEFIGAGADYGLFDAFVQPLATVVDNDKDSWFGITFTADDTASLSIGGNAANTGIAIPGTTGVVQRMAYAQILEILGDCSCFYPFAEASGTSITDYSPNGHTLTPSEDVSTFDTAPSYQGSVQIYTFNGTDEELDAADHGDFTTTTAFSVGCAFKPATAASNVLFSKWDETTGSELREWRLYTDSNGYPSFDIYDETNNAGVGREDQTTVGTGAWKIIFGVFDGGTDAANAKVYVNGVQTDDADIVDDAGFADMVDTATVPAIGYQESTGGAKENFIDGAATLFFFTKKELSADECWNLYQIYRGLLNV